MQVHAVVTQPTRNRTESCRTLHSTPRNVAALVASRDILRPSHGPPTSRGSAVLSFDHEQSGHQASVAITIPSPDTQLESLIEQASHVMEVEARGVGMFIEGFNSPGREEACRLSHNPSADACAMQHYGAVNLARKALGMKLRGAMLNGLAASVTTQGGNQHMQFVASGSVTPQPWQHPSRCNSSRGNRRSGQPAHMSIDDQGLQPKSARTPQQVTPRLTAQALARDSALPSARPKCRGDSVSKRENQVIGNQYNPLTSLAASLRLRATPDLGVKTQSGALSSGETEWVTAAPAPSELPSVTAQSQQREQKELPPVSVQPQREQKEQRDQRGHRDQHALLEQRVQPQQKRFDRQAQQKQPQHQEQCDKSQQREQREHREQFDCPRIGTRCSAQLSSKSPDPNSRLVTTQISPRTKQEAWKHDESSCPTSPVGCIIGGTDISGISSLKLRNERKTWLQATEQQGKLNARHILLLQSVFKGRPPVLMFPCPGPPTLPGKHSRILGSDDFDCTSGDLPRMYFSHTEETHEYNAVLRTLDRGGLYRTSMQSGRWCLCWSGCPKPEMLRNFHPFQVTNHFPGSWNIGRKDLMWRNIRCAQRRIPNQFDITPPSFVLPDDMRLWEASRAQNPNAFWIWKPVNSSCGRGIKVLRSTLDASTEKSLSQKKGVVQRYVEAPLLLDGYKFDLRLYVIVTSFDPLKVYLNPEGLVRLATQRYSSSPGKLHCRRMHLTNYSINKHADAYVKNLDLPSSPRSGTKCGKAELHHEDGAPVPAAEEPETDAHCSDSSGDESKPQTAPESGPASSKWSMDELHGYFVAHSLDYSLMMERIKDLIIKALIAVEPPIVSQCHQGASFQGGSNAQSLRGLGPNPSCFEIYGFDVLIDQSLVPWLLEVNILPSFSSSSPLDKRIKTRLIAEALTLVGLRPYDHRLIGQALREEREGQVSGLHPKAQAAPKSHTLNTLSQSTLWELGHAEWATIAEAHDEFMRRGSLQRVFPTEDGMDRYADLFACPRYANLVLAKWLREGGEACFRPEVAHLLPACAPQPISCEEY